MERSRLKNVIIVILALVNVFLLFSLATRQVERANARSRTLSELTVLCSADSIQLNTDLPDGTPPAGKTLERSADADKALAVSALGKNVALSDEGGGISTGSTADGQVFFRADGSFTITGRLADGDVEDACRKFCRSNGYKDFVKTSDSEDSSSAGVFATAVQYFENYPVANATVEFLVKDGILISISGTHLPTSAAETAGSGTAMTAATALSRFLNARRENGAVVSEILDIYACYELQSSTSSLTTLNPAWCIVTDTADYYVNCSTGAVSHS